MSGDVWETQVDVPENATPAEEERLIETALGKKIDGDIDGLLDGLGDAFK